MKPLKRLAINPERLMKNDELITLRGSLGTDSYPSYRCYFNLGIFGHCTHFLGYINTASCAMAYEICDGLYGGGCVEGGDCSPF